MSVTLITTLISMTEQDIFYCRDRFYREQVYISAIGTVKVNGNVILSKVLLLRFFV
jgi:hypothetical protein